MKLKKRMAAVFFACVLGLAFMMGGCGGTTAEDVQNHGPAESVISVASDGSVYLKAASYNIKNCGNGETVDQVASVIQNQDLDVVCLQEVDNQTKRAGGKDIVKLLAEACGLPYYHYYRAMDFQGGGYGIAILSKYALSNCETAKLKTKGEEEPRVLAKAEIKAENGQVITVFNTHLSFESDETRANQMKYLNEQTAGKQAVLLMGDFNIQSFEEYSALPALKPVNTAENPLASYRGDDEGFRNLDNIFYSSDFQALDIKMVDSDASDHNMLVLYAQIAA